jgi:lipopolysaccharide transport system ATP-binding protein
VSDNIVLRVKNVGKRFKLYPNPWRRIQEWLSLGRKVCHTDFWAVREVSFELERGHCFGIIGVNGAGKSTLLKIITGVLVPTEGSYQTQGRVLSLLELGIGQNNALTGRQNVIVSAQLLGFPDDYAQQRMAQIAEFAELGDFFERPVATYSTGMRMRLAFSLFAFLECDVLILDEVMAVGDIFFQQKCYARLDELLAQKTTIILVTHDLSAIQQYCQEVMVLHQGHKIFQGRPDEAIRTYVQVRGTRTAKAIEMTLKLGDPSHSDFPKFRRPFAWPPDDAFFPLPASAKLGGKHAHFTRVALCNESGQPCQVFKQGETAIFYYEFVPDKDIGVPIGSIEITNPYNLLLHSNTTLQHQMGFTGHSS